MNITVKELLENCAVQSEFRLCYYDYDKNERVYFLKDSYLVNNKVRFLYVDDGYLYIEIEKDD